MNAYDLGGPVAGMLCTTHSHIEGDSKEHPLQCDLLDLQMQTSDTFTSYCIESNCNELLTLGMAT
jgi:hypothetical protein